MIGRLRPEVDRLLLLARCALGLRWLAFGAVLFLSLHHWMRVGYWEFSGVWQYGLVLLDPRVAAALTWWLIQAAFYILVLLPAAEWLSSRLPSQGCARVAAAVALAIGLGTRGVVGPLIVRATVAAPATLHAGHGEQLQSWLTNPYAARWLVAVTESWWLLPFFVLAVHLAPARPATASEAWRLRGLLALFALLQPVDAPYLLTAGGPRGATATLPLIAIQEGWGRQEFGYASVIAVLLSVVAATVWLLPMRAATAAPVVSHRTAGKAWPWVMLAAILLAPLAAAVLRGLSWSHAAPPLATVIITFLSVALASVWTGVLGAALARGLPSMASLQSRLPYAALLFPSLVLVLPWLRPLGLKSDAAAVLAVLLGTVFLTPYLGLSTVAARAVEAKGAGPKSTLVLTMSIVAWAVWTDLTLPLLLSQGQHPLLPLQGWMLWDLSTHLRVSPLSVPGWSAAWIGGSLLGGFAAFRLLGLR